jgi:hypothetical protein
LESWVHNSWKEPRYDEHYSSTARAKLTKKKMSDKNNESALFDLALFVIGSSRTVCDETPRYAAFRMLQIFQKMAQLENTPEDSKFLKEISDTISANDEILLRGSKEEFIGFLDSLVSRAAGELKLRHQ